MKNSAIYLTWSSMIIALTLPLSVMATDFHVSPKGKPGKCSSSSPCDLATGIKLAGRGDDVILHDGVYKSRIKTHNDGVTFRAEHTGKAILEATSTTYPLIEILNSDITTQGLHLDGKTTQRGIAVQNIKNVSNIIIQNCTIQNVRSQGIQLVARKKSTAGRAEINNVKIKNNTIIGTGFHDVGEGIYVGSPDPKRTGNGVVMEVTNVEISNNTIEDFTDNCIEAKEPTRNVNIQHNTCRNEVKGVTPENQGTIEMRGYNHIVSHNTFENVRGGIAVFNIAAMGGITVTDNTVNKSIGTRYAIHTRSRGFGNTPSQVSHNHFSNLSSKTVIAKYGIHISDNQGL